MDSNGYRGMLLEKMCVLNVQDIEDRTPVLYILCHCSCSSKTILFLLNFQFHVTESHDLKLFAIRVQYIQWGMLE
jgi:hypothetical protein